VSQPFLVSIRVDPGWEFGSVEIVKGIEVLSVHEPNRSRDSINALEVFLPRLRLMRG
jgi:hypothetical protein